MEEEVDGWGPLATLTQLVRLIKRVFSLWVRAQTHQEAGSEIYWELWTKIFLQEFKVDCRKNKEVTKLLLIAPVFAAGSGTGTAGKASVNEQQQCNIIRKTAVCHSYIFMQLSVY